MVEEIQPLLHLVKLLAVKLHIRHIFWYFPVKVIEQRINIFQFIGKLARPVVISFYTAQFSQCVADCLRRGLVAVCGELIRLVCRFYNLSAVCHSSVLALKLFILAHRQAGFLDLLKLKLRKWQFLCLCPVIYAERGKLFFGCGIQLILFFQLWFDHCKRFPWKSVQNLHMVFLVQ